MGGCRDGGQLGETGKKCAGFKRARETTKNFPEILNVLREGAAGNQDVVKVHKYPIQTPKNSVHQALKSLSRVFEAKGHPQKLK